MNLQKNIKKKKKSAVTSRPERERERERENVVEFAGVTADVLGLGLACLSSS